MEEGGSGFRWNYLQSERESAITGLRCRQRSECNDRIRVPHLTLISMSTTVAFFFLIVYISFFFVSGASGWARLLFTIDLVNNHIDLPNASKPEYAARGAGIRIFDKVRGCSKELEAPMECSDYRRSTILLQEGPPHRGSF